MSRTLAEFGEGSQAGAFPGAPRHSDPHSARATPTPHPATSTLCPHCKADLSELPQDADQYPRERREYSGGEGSTFFVIQTDTGPEFDAVRLRPAAFVLVCFRGQYLYLPRCSYCREIIFNLDEGTICVIDGDRWRRIKLGDAPAQLIGSTVFALHWKCDVPALRKGVCLVPWSNLGAVIRHDQSRQG